MDSIMNLLKINRNQCKNCQYLILLFATSFLPSDWEKYSLEELYKVAKQNHITIIIMDACKYFQPIAFRGESPVVFNEKQREIIQYEVIRTKKELSENIKYYADKSLFFPMFDDYYDVREFYSLARRYDLMYGYINGILGDISVVTESKSKKIGISLFKTLFAPGKINSILYNRIFRRVFATCSRKGRGVFFAVEGKNKENEIMQNCNLLKNAKKIQTHTYDYERYLRWKRSIYDNENICPLKQPYMVFLDQYIPFHPDLKATGYSIDADTYYHNVEMILNHLSKELNLNIAIAAHPKANYKKLPYFAKYEIFYNSTLPLIYYSDLVVGHFSSSLSYAVLENKRIVLINDSSLEGCSSYQDAIKQYQDMLHCPLVDEKVTTNDLPSIEIDYESYQGFIKNTIGEVRDKDKNLWENILMQIWEY